MSAPLKAESIVVVSGGAGDPKIVAGTVDPTTGLGLPEGSIYLRYGAGAGQAYVKSGAGDTNWGQVPAGGGAASGLDGSYDYGGAGGGRIIAVDSGAVRLDAGTNDAQAALHIQRLPSGASAAVGIDLTLNANFNASGVGLSVTDPGAGTSIKVTKSNSGSAYFADLTSGSAKALEIVVTAAPTSVSPVSIVANTTGTTADLLSISKIPGSATAGNALSVSMGANTTGAGLYVSQAGTGAAIEIAAGAIQVANSAAGVSAANTGRIRYNSGTQKFEASLNGAAYSDLGGGMAIGTTITSATAGSVLFAGAAGVLAQDNANFFWDDTNNRLGIGTAAPTWALHVKAAGSGVAAGKLETTATDAYTEFEYYDSSGVFKAGIGYGNSAVAVAHVQSKIFVYSSGPDVVFANATNSAFTFGMTAASVALQMQNGGSAAVSAASTGKLRYNTTGQKAQWSFNGAAYFDVGTYAAALTAGSVPFANASNQLAQDNANFFWDNTNKVFGIGTASPDSGRRLHISIATSGAPLAIETTSASGTATAVFKYSGSVIGGVGYGTSGTAEPANQNRVYLQGATVDVAINTGSPVRTALFASFSTTTLGIHNTAPGCALDVGVVGGTATAVALRGGSTATVSASSTGRLRYNESTNIFQVSKNAAAYEDVATLATAQTYTKSQNVARVGLTDAANIATDASLGNIFSVTLAGNRTLDNPTNLVDGGTYSWIITQDGTGSRTLAYGALFKWPGGTVPVLSTAAGAVDLITAIYNGTILAASINKAFA